MATYSAAISESQRPPITDVISQYVTLRKCGRELWGLCPFHSDKHPSLSVNAEKNFFLCRSCGVGGDAITFIRKIEGIDFKTAAKRIGLETYRPSPEQLEIRREAKKIASWAKNTSAKICDGLREIGDEISICRLARSKPYTDQKLLAQHEAILIRQWTILTDLDDDLHRPKLAVDLWAQRGEINAFVESFA